MRKTQADLLFETRGEIGKVSHEALIVVRLPEKALDRYQGGDFLQALLLLEGFEVKFI
jgi:hypothetical protein